MSLVDSGALLTQLLDRVLAQHRAGLNPTFGQVEDLVDLNARVKRDIEVARATGTVIETLRGPVCDVIGCRSTATVSGDGGRFCYQHADLVERVVGEVRERLHAAATDAVRAELLCRPTGVARG